jgi:uncharacterized membrane protein YdjX (TVP38/TMEM64 family)
MLIIFLAASVPNPAFDLFGASAGAVKMPSWKFFIACWCGKTVKNTCLALGGMAVVGAILNWIGVEI